MDCYPEYKHHVHPNHQHFNSPSVAANHPYYPGNYGSASMRYAHAHASSYGESGGGGGGQQQQPNWIEGYSRYNHASQHHLNHHGNYSGSFGGHYGPQRENYHASGGGEPNGQFYYQNAHQTSAGYYGNHSYDASYRNSSSYHYHYGGGGGTGAASNNSNNTSSSSNSSGSAGYHQSASQPQQSFYPPSYSEQQQQQQQQFNSRYYPTPPPSAPPQSQRDPYSMSATTAHSSEGGSSSYAPPPPPSSIESESSGKLSNERLSIDDDNKSASNEAAPPVASSPSPSSSKQSAECVESDHRKAEAQQAESETSSSPSAESKASNESERTKSENEAAKADGCVDSEKKASREVKHASPTSSPFNESPHHLCNESLKGSQDASTALGEAENSIATGEPKSFFPFLLFASLFSFIYRVAQLSSIVKHAIKRFSVLLIAHSRAVFPNRQATEKAFFNFHRNARKIYALPLAFPL